VGHPVGPLIHLPEGATFNPLDSSRPACDRPLDLAHFAAMRPTFNPARRLLYTG